ncbi:hypothetical protein D3C87_1308860 [compost metagenome]
MARHLDAVDIDQFQARQIAQGVRHFQGRNVLALPAIGIADAVDEVAVTVGVLAQQVAGTPVSIALAKHIATDFALGRFA